MMKRCVYIILLGITALWAGKYGDAFMIAAYPAAAMGTGHIGVTQLTGIRAVPINPAGLSYGRKMETYLQYNALFGLGFQYGLGYKNRYGDHWHWSVLWNRVGVNAIEEHPDLSSMTTLERRDFVRTQAGTYATFDSREDLITLTLGRHIRHRIDLGWQYDEFFIENPVGISVKVLNKSLYGESARGIGADAGLRLIIPGNEIFYIRNLGEIVFGVTAQNVYSTGIYWTTGHVDQARMRMLWGAALHQPVRFLYSDLRLMVQNVWLDDPAFHWGVEWEIMDALAFRLGKDDLSMNAGAGVRFPMGKYHLIVDYAFQDHPLDVGHKVSLTLTREDAE
ncbi:hypothetical protein [Fidelibacter multiformis]|jgi:hypothetical protein|uniref:hypothetical protein n=1 Tax=Fidelibacter multiformis TaxID=3377529 RepID=UPI0037DD5B50